MEPKNFGVLLRRKLDYAFPNQRAEVFVADASVFPTNIWANCQATVMAMAHHASKFIAA